MRFLVCPLCGKSSTLRAFADAAFTGDILTQTFRGLGRGRGFAVASRDVLLDDNPTTRLIGSRALALVVTLLDHQLLAADTARRTLGFPGTDADDERLAALCVRIERRLGPGYTWRVDVDDAPLAALEERVTTWRHEYDALLADGEADDHALLDLVEQVDAALDDAARPFDAFPDDDPVAALRERVHDLLDAYEAAAALTEDAR
jgi:hypothetical protein